MGKLHWVRADGEKRGKEVSLGTVAGPGILSLVPEPLSRLFKEGRKLYGRVKHWEAGQKKTVLVLPRKLQDTSLVQS